MFLPCPLPSSIKPLSRTVYQPSSLSSSSPCSIATACDTLLWHCPLRDTKDHLSSITKSPLSYVSVSSIKILHTLHYLRAPHILCSTQIPWPLPSPGGRGSLSSCPTALSDLLAFLWLCFLIAPAIPQSKQGSHFSLLDPFFSSFGNFYSPGFKIHFYKWLPNLYLNGSKQTTMLHPKSGSYSFLYVSVHSSAILSTFQTWNIRVILDFHLYSGPQGYILWLGLSSLSLLLLGQQQGMSSFLPHQLNPTTQASWNCSLLHGQHPSCSGMLRVPASFLVSSSFGTNYTFNRKIKGKTSKRTERDKS